MSPEAGELLAENGIFGFDPEIGDNQKKLSVGFPPGTINVEGAEQVRFGWLYYVGDCIALMYVHPAYGVCGTIRTALSHKVGSDWVANHDNYYKLGDPNKGKRE